MKLYKQGGGWFRKNVGWLLLISGVTANIYALVYISSLDHPNVARATEGIMMVFAFLFYIPAALLLGFRLKKTHPKPGLIVILVAAVLEALALAYAIFAM